MIEVKENMSENTLNESARQYLFDALDRMATAQAKRNKMFYSNGKIVLENIMGEIPSYVSRDDLLTSTKTSILDKTYDRIINVQARIDMKSSKKDQEACKLGLEKALNADISQTGQKKYRMGQFNEILKEFEVAVTGILDEDVLRGLYHKTSELEKSLEIIDLDQETYQRYMMYIAKIRHNLADKLFDLKLEQVKEHQKQKQKTR